MLPGFGYKQPFPQAVSPHMKMGASNSPFSYDTWPHHHGYPVPTQCHSCCNQNTYPNYYPYVPHPYTHLPPPPPPVHPQFYYPVYPEPYPFHYAPPHHYTMELPKYEYDKSIPHCHGCNSHSKDQGVKIEEQGSEAQKPIVWVPSGYMKNQERRSASTESRGDGEMGSKISGWMPLDMDNLKRLLQTGKLSKDEDDQPKNQVKEMPFPLVWLPYNNEERGQSSIPTMGHEDKNGEIISVEKRDKPPRTIAVKHEDDQPKNQLHQMPFPIVFLPCSNEEKGQKSIPADKTGEKTSVEKRDKPLRTIHVQPLNEIDGAHSGNGVKAENKEDEKKSGEKDEKKSGEKDAKSKPSSPTKASKLPPICLRIDPLPKKKNGGGKSRSPSPPRDKVQQVEVVEPSSCPSSPSASPSPSSPSLSSVAEKDVVEVNKPSRVAGNDSEANQETQKVKEKKSEKKMLSGEEAATIIQSIYRGYEVRRWEPLKKMRHIAKIQEEAAALKKCIESSVGSMDLKQKTALGENIMSLLLKLDTIQGLHSSVRDIRKSVARELVSLQEMLDTIMVKKPEETITSVQKDDSPRSLAVSEVESKASQAEDESGMSSSLSRDKDHTEAEIEEDTEGKTCSLHEPCTMEESCTVEELEPCDVSHEQVAEPEVVTTTSIGGEVGRNSSDSVYEQDGIDAVEDSGIKNVASVESKPIGRDEGHVDSADQIDMVLDSPDELHVVSEDSAKLHQDEASKDVEFASSVEVHEGSDCNVTEPVNVEVAGVEEEVICSTGNNKAKEDEAQVQEFNCSITEPVEVEAPLNDEAEVAEEVQMVSVENNKAKGDELQVQEELNYSVTEPMKVEAPLNDDAEEVKMASSGNNKVKGDETQVQEFDCNVTEPVKVETQVTNEAEEAEEVKMTISSTENKEDKSRRRAMEDTEKMRELLEKMIESGKEQQQVVYNLNQKIKELEGKLAKQKEMKKQKKKKARVFLPRGPRKSLMAKQS